MSILMYIFTKISVRCNLRVTLQLSLVSILIKLEIYSEFIFYLDSAIIYRFKFTYPGNQSALEPVRLSSELNHIPFILYPYVPSQ